MLLDDSDQLQGGNLLEIAENQLRSDWSNLNENLLQPLVTRVTDQVLMLK